MSHDQPVWDQQLWNDATLAEKLVANLGAVVLKPQEQRTGFFVPRPPDKDDR